MGYLRGGGLVAPSGGPYLRGTNKTAVSLRAPTLANKLRRLELQVYNQRPELKQHKKNRTILGGSGTISENYSACSSLTGSTTFRDNVLGDRWINKRLLVDYNCINSTVDLLRCIVMIPRKPGVSWTPATGFEFTAHPEHTEFTVLADRTFDSKFTGGCLHGKVWVNLKNMISLFDSQGGSMARNDIVIYTYFKEGASGTANDIKQSLALYYVNK